MAKPWREHKNPWDEADRLEVRDVCRRMGWTTRRLTNELERVASADAFLARVAAALKELDPPRLMHRDPAKGTTTNPALAAKGEPELVPKDYEETLAIENNVKDHTRKQLRHEARQKLSLANRLALIESESRRRRLGLHKPLHSIRREIERAERRLDNV